MVAQGTSVPITPAAARQAASNPKKTKSMRLQGRLAHPARHKRHITRFVTPDLVPQPLFQPPATACAIPLKALLELPDKPSRHHRKFLRGNTRPPPALHVPSNSRPLAENKTKNISFLKASPTVTAFCQGAAKVTLLAPARTAPGPSKSATQRRPRGRRSAAPARTASEAGPRALEKPTRVAHPECRPSIPHQINTERKGADGTGRMGPVLGTAHHPKPESSPQPKPELRRAQQRKTALQINAGVDMQNVYH
mmetsp:Transcript_42609/g.69198  ORF Transcript_42609/g.69198 Transcript_42609/m.69198 type:complete len:252 (-) Transcript_42609:182-937(-)